jgi:uncharacterized protein YdhG (YjbR/CyaY superfamily)
MKSDKPGFVSVDEYIRTFPPGVQKVLEELRTTIKTVAPDAKETISYKMPTFTLNGTYLIYFAGWKKHVSIYPIPSGTEAFNKEISKYVDGKGTVKFPLDKPLPLKLISRIVKYRMIDTLKNAETKYGKKK